MMKRHLCKMLCAHDEDRWDICSSVGGTCSLVLSTLCFPKTFWFLYIWPKIVKCTWLLLNMMQNPAFISCNPLSWCCKAILAVQLFLLSDSDIVAGERHCGLMLANTLLRLYRSARQSGPEYREADGVDGLPLTGVPTAPTHRPIPPTATAPPSPVFHSCQLVCLGSC